MNSRRQFLKPILLSGLLLLSGAAYYLLGYKTARENFLQVLSLFSFLFALYFIGYRFFSLAYFRYLAAAGILFRLVLLFSVPNLSDDVYRFIWDGRLAANGVNPFSHLPADVMRLQGVPGIDRALYEQLNSPNYFAIYPPVLQVVFWLAAKVFPTNVYGAIVFFKFVIILFEVGNIILLGLLLKKLSLPEHLSVLYILNPLVITELSGNVHFESIMIFFVLLSFLLLFHNKWKASALCLGFGIATKLLPLLFIALVMKKLGPKRGWLYAVIAGVTTLLLFLFFFDLASLQNMIKSIDLFFQKFEFNASIYYLVRWVGTLVTGYNLISFAGPLLSLVAAILILSLSFKTTSENNKAFLISSLFIISAWFLFATTVHPWYTCLPVALAVFTPLRYAFVWSFTATFSYAAYQYNPVQENLWLIGGGYLVVLAYAWWEVKKNRVFPIHAPQKVT